MASCALWLFVEQANGEALARAPGREKHEVLVTHPCFSHTGLPWPSWVCQLLKATAALLASLPLQVSPLQVSVAPPSSSPSRLGWNTSSSSTNSGFLYYLLRFPYILPHLCEQTCLNYLNLGVPSTSCCTLHCTSTSCPLPTMETIHVRLHVSVYMCSWKSGVLYACTWTFP